MTTTAAEPAKPEPAASAAADNAKRLRAASTMEEGAKRASTDATSGPRSVSAHTLQTLSQSSRSFLKQPGLVHEPSLRARVPRAVLEGGSSGPFRRSGLKRLVRRLRPRAAVSVEPLHAPGLSTSVLYASETASVDDACPFAETELTSGPPSGDLVFADSPFEIRVAGMLVRQFDGWGPSGAAGNELLMYSIQNDPSAQASGDTAESLPFIHFDHRSDAYTSIDRPNTYIPIPASKAYVTGSAALPRAPKPRPARTADATGAPVPPSTGSMRSVNVQFKILEIDSPSENVKQAISRIDELGGIINKFTAATPALGILSPALSVAGSVSKQALDSYARPDKVISIDMDFLLADRSRVAAGTSPPGEYLRYGYYFFLAEPMEGKLYASVLTPKNVQLMLHRDDSRLRRRAAVAGADPARAESRKFFPLTQVSYLVVRVSEPTCGPSRRRRPIQMAHARELEEIFNRAKSSEDPAKLKRAVKDLGQNLGMLDSDSEEGA